MNKSNQATISKNHARPAVLVGAVLLAIAGWADPGISFPKDSPSEQKVQLMFVQTAEDIKVDAAAKKLRLVKVNQQTLYFSDRPQRLAGHLTMPAYLDEWKAGAGSDNFANDPPNATLSVYEGGRNENTLTVVEISNPAIEGQDLVYSYKLIDGTMPKSSGAAALFIDWIGVGGGVGPGFHGVGAGARGVGVY